MKKKFQVFTNYNQLFLIPTISISYEFDLTKPWTLDYLFLDIMWLKWGLEIEAYVSKTEL